MKSGNLIPRTKSETLYDIYSSLDQRANVNNNLFKVKVNDVIVNALFDSGSNVNIIKSSFAKQLKLKMFNYSSSLKGFNGSRSQVYKKVLFSLIYNDKTVNCDAVISDEVEYDLLICMKTMEQLKIIWNFATGKCLNMKEIEINSKDDV